MCVAHRSLACPVQSAVFLERRRRRQRQRRDCLDTMHQQRSPIGHRTHRHRPHRHHLPTHIAPFDRPLAAKSTLPGWRTIFSFHRRRRRRRTISHAFRTAASLPVSESHAFAADHAQYRIYIIYMYVFVLGQLGLWSAACSTNNIP